MSELLNYTEVNAYIEVNDMNYPASISFDKNPLTNDVIININPPRSMCGLNSVKVKITVPMKNVIEMAQETLKTNSISYEQPVMLHFLSLMEALEIPHPEWWITQPPQSLCAVAKCVVKQAKDMYEINKNE